MNELKLRIRTIKHLAYRLGYPPEYLEEIASRVPTLYIFWSEPKPSGDGMRDYSTPVRELKLVQRRLNNLFKTITYPSTSHYGLAHHSNITNAAVHYGQEIILNFDIKHFFPSIHPTRVYKALIQEQGCSGEVASLITRLVTVNYQLPQGAPTSTYIANIVTMRLQRRLKGLVKAQWKGSFTSYADDLSCSGNKYLGKCVDLMHRIIVSDGFSEKLAKRVVATKSMAQTVTGVNVGHGFGISRKKRRLWKAELFKAQMDYSNEEIDQQSLQKAERRFDARMNHARTVKTIGHRILQKDKETDVACGHHKV